MNDLEIYFGEVVRTHRRRLGLSQEEFAHRAGIHRTYASSIERGRVQVSISVAAQLAAALDVKLSRLFRDIERLAESAEGDAAEDT
jgi:transcriptional regulator with XRE-family HTH domain